MSNSPFSQLVSEILTQADSATPKLNSQSKGDFLYGEVSERVFASFEGLKKSNSKVVTVFYKGDRDIFSIDKQKNAIKVTINAKFGRLEDPKNLLRDVSKIGHWGNGDYQLKIDNTEHLDYLCEMIKQIY